MNIAAFEQDRRRNMHEDANDNRHQFPRIMGQNCVGADGQASLPQRDIARWPLSIGINLGKLGA